MSNSETESASTTLENSVEANIEPVNKKNNTTPTNKKNNNYSNSMKSMYGNNSNAFENNKKNNTTPTNASNNKKNNTTPTNVASNNKPTDSDLDSKMNEIQPMLEKLKELKTSYESASNTEKTSMQEEFESTKGKVIDIQEEINTIVSSMNEKSNTFAFFEEKYPTYMKTLKELDVIKNNSTESVEEETMGSVMSNQNNAMNVNQANQANAETVVNNNNKNSNAGSVVNLNSNTKNNAVSSLNNNNNTKKNNTKPVNNSKNNTKKNNTKPVNNIYVPISNNYSRKTLTTGGRRRKNKSRKANKRR